MKRIIFAAAMAVLLSACAEDYDAGLDAYNAGDYETAYEIWRPLAEQGDAEALNNLGYMYGDGIGVEQDDVEAVRLYKLAAEQDHASAMNNLGWMYEHGRGVEQDDVEAVRLYKLAAEQDNASAMSNLGWMYQHGRGVEQDLDTAKMWYELAVENENEWAEDALSNLSQLPEMKRKPEESGIYGVLPLFFSSGKGAIGEVRDCKTAFERLRADSALNNFEKRTSPFLALQLNKASSTGQLFYRPHSQCVSAFISDGGNAGQARSLCAGLNNEETLVSVRQDHISNHHQVVQHTASGQNIDLGYHSDSTSGFFRIRGQDSIPTYVCEGPLFN